MLKAKLFIDGNYAENIDLVKIAGKAHFSKYHFIRLFSSVYGQTPHHYLSRVRISQAERLLKKHYNIAEVSISVGFDSSTSFSAVFKKQVGMSPSAYQKKQQQKQAAIKANPLIGVPNCFAQNYGWHK